MFVVVVVVSLDLHVVFVSRLCIWPCFSRFLFECVQRVDVPRELSTSTHALIVGSAVLLRRVVRLVPRLALLVSVHLMHLTPLLVSLRVSPVVIVLLVIAVSLIAVLLVSPLPRVIVLLVLALRRSGVTQPPLVGKPGVPACLIIPLPLLVLLSAVVALLVVALIPCIIRSGSVILVVRVLCVEPGVAVWVWAPAICNVVPFPTTVGARCHTWAVPHEMFRASAAIAPCVRLRPVIPGSCGGWLRLRGDHVFLYCRDFSCDCR